MNFKIEHFEYEAKIVSNNGLQKYFVQFMDVSSCLQIKEVSKNVFLQFFGVHKVYIENNKKHYFISYSDGIYKCEEEMNRENYLAFNSFLSWEYKANNIKKRYLEYSELDDNSIYQRSLHKPLLTTSIVENKRQKENLWNAIAKLNEIQKRRFLFYCVDNMTYEEISHIKKCSIQSIKESVDRAKKNLRIEIEKFI